MLRFLRRVVLGVLILGLGVYAAVRLSPWPSVLLIRTLFDSDATRAMALLAPTTARQSDKTPRPCL
jgi:hypothetical protein